MSRPAVLSLLGRAVTGRVFRKGEERISHFDKSVRKKPKKGAFFVNGGFAGSLDKTGGLW
jgi:hypothetical protein